MEMMSYFGSISKRIRNESIYNLVQILPINGVCAVSCMCVSMFLLPVFSFVYVFYAFIMVIFNDILSNQIVLYGNPV